MASAREPPLLLVGVRRSGTTLLRVMLDGNPELAIPDESYFIPQLAVRHRRPIDADEFVDDLRRLPTLREWDLPVEAVRTRVRDGMTPGEAVAAIYEAYAERHGKRRWGDKTPMYMQHLPLLDELFPDARYVHLIRDGRDAALSFLSMPEGVVTRTWAHPRSASDFACQWRTEVAAARRLGRSVGTDRYLEVRYEEFVAGPEAALRSICDYAGLPYDPRMLDYTGRVDVSAKPHQQRLKQAPTAGVRDWRQDMSPEDVAAFEAVAGDALRACGYEVTTAGADQAPSPSARLRLGSYRARTAAWRTTARLLQRSPLWRRRHAPLA
jgi:Sulfotransferase family